MVVDVFVEFALLFAITLVVSGIVKFLKQPLIIGYILSGILVGPLVFNFVHSTDTVLAFGHMGIAFLLFIVGLGLNPKVIKEVGKVSIIGGLGQVIFTSLAGFGICILLGFSTITSLYIGIALTFSSTIIVMKLLSDKKELETLYARITMGFLVVQDLIAIILLIFLSTLPVTTSSSDIVSNSPSILYSFAAVVIIALLSWLILPRLTTTIARSQEFLLLFSIGWCFSLAALFYYFNISIEAGALLAGITLSFSPYSPEISAKIRPLRDFFIVLFFVLMGSQMVFADLSVYIIPILMLSFFILLGNPLIVIIIMSLLGYTKRNSFLTGLAIAQVSEFSFVLVSLGVKTGHLNQEIVSMVTFIGLITITISSYFVLYSNKIYPIVAPFLSLLEKKGKKCDELGSKIEKRPDIILFGYNRIGFDVLKSVEKIGKKFLVIDYDPAIIEKLTKMNYSCKYGDVEDMELLDELDFSSCKMAISTIPSKDTNLLLIRKIRSINKNTIITVISHQIDETLDLYEAGATYVIMPHFLGGKHISSMIEEFKFDLTKFSKERRHHINDLHQRKGLGHEHPKPEGRR